jgi:hypothetical protein
MYIQQWSTGIYHRNATLANHLILQVFTEANLVLTGTMQGCANNGGSEIPQEVKCMCMCVRAWKLVCVSEFVCVCVFVCVYFSSGNVLHMWAVSNFVQKGILQSRMCVYTVQNEVG